MSSTIFHKTANTAAELIGSYFSRAGLVVLVVLLTACSATVINIEGSFPAPLVQKIPLTIGV
ncbi:MAG: hypothetical protein VW337_01420, partial [Gammaproteobacteria bacterium]